MTPSSQPATGVYASAADLVALESSARHFGFLRRQPVFTEEKDRPALFVVDQRINIFFGTRRVMKSVAAAEVAALSAWRVLATRASAAWLSSSLPALNP